MEDPASDSENEPCLVWKMNHESSTSEPDVVKCSFDHYGSKAVEIAECQDCPNEEEPQWSLKRRLSHGDIPYGFSQTSSSTNELDFLLGRVIRTPGSSHHIRVTEVAPTNSSIRQGVNHVDDIKGRKFLCFTPMNPRAYMTVRSNGIGIVVVLRYLKDDVVNSSWKMPVEIFSSKKQTDVKKLSRRVRCYYKAQDELISAYEDIALGIEVEMSPRNLQEQYRRSIVFAKVTLCINFLLLVGKVAASVISGSMSIISSLVDSSLDLLSGGVMWWATQAVKNRDIFHYPQGRTKLEPVAIIILSVAMALASLQLIRESVEKLIGLALHTTDLPNIEVVTFTISGITVVVKCVLMLICRREKSPTVLALAQDHRNDVVSNITAIIFGYWGSGNLFAKTDIYGFVFLDPVGAILISVYIMYNWWKTGSEQIKCLTGHTARPDFLSKLTWVCVNHHIEVKHIDTVRAFHFGNNFLVEVDIVLPRDMRLREAHDIGESLQQRLESLPEVERAFVHLDYEFTHNPHSEHKIV